MKQGFRTTRMVMALAAAAALGACGEPPSVLEQVKATGELRVATLNSATTYYIGPSGQEGFEYELARAFADDLGVSLKIIIPPNLDQLLSLVSTGRAHFAAAGLTVTQQRSDIVRFGPTYQVITEQVVYRTGQRRPRAVDDLVGKRIEVMAGSSYAERLGKLQEDYPDLAFTPRNDLGIEELAERVWSGAIDYTVMDSHTLAQIRRIYPELGVAFDLSGPQHLAWAFPIDTDRSLYDAASAFILRLRDDGQLKQIRDRYFGPWRTFDYVDSRKFLRHIDDRLPKYRRLFERTAGAFEDFDWQLLAALAYQESRWDPRARSPTGVRGLMMLTLTTAKQMGVKNRLDPQQSIRGGAEYLSRIKAKLPERIPEPDRTWLALAAYNVGFGHLEDARILTERAGGDPDTWISVRDHLPLLSRKQWYAKTRFGYARGTEPVRFVANVRRYYEVLRTLTAGNPQQPEGTGAAGISIDSPVL